MHACSHSRDAVAQMTTGAPCISIIGGLTPIFRGTITVHNKEFQQSVTLEFRRDSAWKSLAFKEVVKDGVGPSVGALTDIHPSKGCLPPVLFQHIPSPARSHPSSGMTSWRACQLSSTSRRQGAYRFLDCPHVQIFGFMEKDGRMLERPILTGSWNDRIVAHMPDGSLWTLFEVNPLPYGPNRYDETCATSAETLCSARDSHAVTLPSIAAVHKTVLVSMCRCCRNWKQDADAFVLCAGLG